MSEWMVGETATETVPLALGGQTFTTDYAVDPGGASWAPAITNPAGGIYVFSEVVGTAGVWIWVGTSSITGDQITITWDVDATEASVTTSTSGSTTTALAELRRRCARLLDDYDRLTATGGTSSTLIDVLTIASGEHYNGREGVVTSGVYAGAKFRVTRTEQSVGTITFAPSLGGVIAPGTTADLFNKRGRGFRIQEYDDVLKMCHSNAFPIHRPDVSVALAAYDWDTETLALPASIYELHTVEFQDPSGYWHVVEPAMDRNYDGWHLNTTDNTLEISGLSPGMIDGSPLRAIGYGRQADLENDYDLSAINAEWLVEEACHHLCLLGLSRDPRFAQMQPAFERRATQKRKMTQTLRRAGTSRAGGTGSIPADIGPVYG